MDFRLIAIIMLLSVQWIIIFIPFYDFWSYGWCFLGFTRLVLSLWAMTMLSLYIRVQVNILGRQLYIDTARGGGSSHLLVRVTIFFPCLCHWTYLPLILDHHFSVFYNIIVYLGCKVYMLWFSQFYLVFEFYADKWLSIHPHKW